MKNRKIRVTAVVVYETVIPDDSDAYPGTETWVQRMALEKQWLEEDGPYLIEGMANNPTDVIARVEEVAS